MQTNITNRTIKSLTIKDKPYEIRDTQLKGLLLRIQPSGVMTYYVEFRRAKRVKLGRADAITPVQAREQAKTILSEAYKGEDPTQKKRLERAQTYLQFLEAVYKDWLVLNLRTGEKTFNSLKNSFPEFHDLRLAEITLWIVEKWRSRRHKEGLKATSINRELANLRACITRAHQWGYLDCDPLEKIKPSKVDSSPKVRYLSISEEQQLRRTLNQREDEVRENREKGNMWRNERGYRLLDNFEHVTYVDHLKPAVLISLNTGLRRGELLSLKWSNIDFSQRIVTVIAETAKSGKTRYVHLNEEAFSTVEAWKAQQNTKWDYVFCSNEGQPFHDIRSSWEKVLARAGIENFRWHDLRHTFASKLVMAGVDLNTVRELLGHSDYKMTLRYAHLAPEHKAAAVARLNISASKT
jgi:site-specific recombinase XerD